MAYKPNVPVALRVGQIKYGLQVLVTGNTTATVADGLAWDYTQTNYIINQTLADTASLLTLSTAASGANGIDVGAFAASKLYYVYICGSSYQNPEAPTTCAVMSLAAPSVGPVLPAGFDMYRCVGAIASDSSTHLLVNAVYDNGDYMTYYYIAPQQALNAGTSATFATVDTSTLVPANSSVILDAIITPTAAANTGTVVPDALKANATGFAVVSGAVAAVAQHNQVEVPSDSAAKIAYKVTGSLTLNVLGFRMSL